MDFDGENLMNDETEVDNMSPPSKSVENDPSICGNHIKLKEGIALNDLLENKAVCIEPDFEEDDEDLLDPVDVANYFDQDLQNLIDHDFMNEDEDFFSNFADKAKRMTNVTEDGGVKKFIKREGLESFGVVSDKATVTIHYDLCFEDNDSPYDSTRLRARPERYFLGGGRLLLGLGIGIKTMKKKEIAYFMISPQYAFGEIGCPPRIPPNAQLFAIVELIEFSEDDDVESLLVMTPEERSEYISFQRLLEIVAKLHNRGNDFVKEKEWQLAAKNYVKALRLLESASTIDKEDEAKMDRLLLKIYNNLGYVLFKHGIPNRACVNLQKALSIDPTNVKANFRIALSKKALGNYEDARRYMKIAQRFEPLNNEIGRELLKIEACISREKELEKVMCQRMFSAGSQDTTKKFDENNCSETMREIFQMVKKVAMDDSRNEVKIPLGIIHTDEEERQVMSMAQENGFSFVKTSKEIKLVKRQ